MAMADNCVKDHFTFLWIIENVSELTRIDLESPPFVEHSISEKALCLQIDENEDFRLHLLSENEFLLEESFGANIEVSILDADGSTLISNSNNESELFVNLLTRNEFLKRKFELIVNNTITVQCKIWKLNDKVPTGFCCVRTELETYRKSIVWPVEEFSVLRSSTTENLNELTLDGKKVYPLDPFAVGYSNDKTFFILYLKQNSHSEDVHFDFVIEEGRNYAYVYEVTALDANGKGIASKIERGRISEIYNFPPLISKTQLTNNKSLCLPNDTLLLTCSFEIYFGGIPSKIKYNTPNISLTVPNIINSLNIPIFFDIAVATSRYPMRNIGNIEVNEEEEEGDCCRDSCSLKTALEYLLKDGTQSDTSLSIGHKLYPVHKNIIWSRCPVFEKILSANTMKIIEIKDMDENTLDRLLEYIYTDTLETLDFATALRLYKIAHDYQFLDLRFQCSYVLRENLRGSNVQEIMALAQKCHDMDLYWAAEQWEYAISTDSDKDMEFYDNDMDIW